ncbi:NADH-quinone oxidoreductase subunit J [Marininema mesophilum]|uniref:NADH-quinone oxidoreductase subunit J n=1 Tax=Marininema mesophilum TaxID=1048340 RepID=A0A1H2TDH1_9BACL|nr:NADH-quinone oxidoreductase subunit J [Marininema mesophilum]SDW41817.1 NADH-quinone oxidoreductase subunit J [Marininema mesophilum]
MALSLSGESIAFFVLSMMAIGGGIMMINSTRVVHMVLALAFSLLSIAGIYVLLHAEFLAVVQVLIYTGAISILMLFGIMLTKHKVDEEDGWSGRLGHSLLSFLGVGALFAIVMGVIYRTPFAGKVAATKSFTVEALGKSVFKQYVIPFELTSILLLVALVGAVILAKKEADS